MLNADYKEMLQSLVDAGVEFMLVGAYALAAHGYPRSTMDIDIWVKPSDNNAQAVMQALQAFGAPLMGLEKKDLLRDDTVFQIGVAPRRIDLLTGLTGLKFDEVFARALEIQIENLRVRLPSIDDLIRNKKATGRIQDLADVEVLQRIQEKQAK